MENNYPKVAIMGGGSFATAIAKIVMENVPNIIWYMRRDDQIAEFKRVGHNPSYLSAVSFDLDRIKFTSKINVAVAEADILFFATPSPFLKSHLKKLRRRIDSKIIVIGTYFTGVGIVKRLSEKYENILLIDIYPHLEKLLYTDKLTLSNEKSTKSWIF